MRAVNLLPQAHRSGPRPGAPTGGAYIVLGVLGLLLVLVLAFTLTANQANARKTQAATVKAEADRADAQAKQLGAFGSFASVKATRTASVKQLATGRFDWERFLRELAAKAVKEVAYHRELASEWAIRLGDGTEESAGRMAQGLDWCWRFVPELFEVDAQLEEMIARQTVPDPRGFEAEYYAAIEGVLAEAGLALPPDQRPILGGRRGHHSEHLGPLLAVMQHVPRTYPDSAW